ncbi:MAG TPA: tagaturonate epimerase family protein [Bryobacteraceae bacterium]|nr:tagaturonate epimerase family protein [Bryobacteraceae bacterium]
MTKQVVLPKYSVGVGDRFAHQAKAQLRACILAAEQGIDVIPVWNKSNREHLIIGSEPTTTRVAADSAVKALGWNKPYYIDADHINLKTVDRFAQPCDFFTIDVADLIGKGADIASVQAFADKHPELIGELRIPGVDRSFTIDRNFVINVANKYLAAVQEAGRIYRHIEQTKGKGNFIAEVSMDETDSPQTPVELLIILAAIADEGIPIQTIAPKFTGRFNKGVDYAGDLEKFAQEFSDDVAVIAYAVQQYGLPQNLKLSVHSGSDKFSIYQPIREAIKKFDAGVHLKTAGTTWLEELIGLAEAAGDGLKLAKEIYSEAYAHREELCAPYATVIDIDPAKLPAPEEINKWSSEQFVAALRHDPKSPNYNSSIRQLLHVGFKVAAKMGDRYLKLLEQMEDTVAKNVTTNLFDRHIKPLFLGA